MGRPQDRWRDGRRAVARLAHWYADRHRTDADPLAALSEIGIVRRLLDEAELEAVRDARRRDRSWAEIATKLGVSRQSAWERWRDLDVGGSPVPSPAPAEGARLAEGARPAEGALPPGRYAVLEGLGAAASLRPRRRRVTVPDVVGLTYRDARTRLAGRDLLGVHHDLAVVAADEQEATVTGQSPESGARVPRGTPVRLWVDRGGDAGVREPRRPPPSPLTGRKVVDDAQEAVG